MLSRPVPIVARCLAPRCTLPHRSYCNVESTDLLELLLRNFELSQTDAQNELRWIRQHVESTTLYPIPLHDPKDQTKQIARKLCERRAAGEPLQYILGTTDFGPLTLKARAPVLIPRPETAFITELVANSIASRPEHEQQEVDVVDLCTGSGCIALLLAHLLGPKLRRVRGYDISTEVLELAQENARHHKLDDIVKIQHGDIFDSKLVKEIGKVDVVVSNPPYIPMNEWRRLPRGVREYEDPRALIGDPAGGEGDDQGLTFYRHIAGMLPHVLKPTGQVAVEIGLGQARDVRMILTDRGGMRRTEVWKDLYGVKRMVVGWR